MGQELSKDQFELGWQPTVGRGVTHGLMFSQLKEDHRGYYDPPPVYGASGTGGPVTADGGPEWLHKNFKGSFKSRKEFDQDLYSRNLAINAIKAKWDISPEHPGLRMNHGMRDVHGNFLADKANYRTLFIPGLGLSSYVGGQYYDKPEGQGCLQKVFVANRTMFFLALSQYTFHHVYHVQVKTDPYNQRFILRDYLRNFPKKTGMYFGATTLATSIACISCTARQKDDGWNYFWGGASAGFAYYISRGLIANAMGIGLTLATLGFLFKSMDSIDHGIFRHEPEEQIIDPKWDKYTEYIPTVPTQRYY